MFNFYEKLLKTLAAFFLFLLPSLQQAFSFYTLALTMAFSFLRPSVIPVTLCWGVNARLIPNPKLPALSPTLSWGANT